MLTTSQSSHPHLLSFWSRVAPLSLGGKKNQSSKNGLSTFPHTVLTYFEWHSYRFHYRVVTSLHFSQEAHAQGKIFQALLKTDPVLTQPN